MRTPGPDVQPYQDPAREDWGKTLPTGFYKQLVEHRIVQPCIVLPASASVKAQVFEGDEAYLLVVGTPA